ncbi:DEAD/DEAH box helicase family protein [Brevibacterium sp.]|uniref:DEAD/DEAH box helicase family protein n=1 Tax=Brevibacterium sp. TaxID=1701 RepID=UPI00264A15DA|nr:DEAD/DEAH box helicase family protein [Brevibacterium sp.]MDN6604650.1 DEAD/DEAH box helicase family protein [Brevibacterium sp.]
MSIPGASPSRSPQPPLRRHQREALDALGTSVADDARRSWIVLPPGAGKTRVGIEHAKNLLDAGHVSTVVAFGPNTAIQTQWANSWNSHSSRSPDDGADDAADARDAADRAGLDRKLTTRFTALTYQSLAVFDDDRDSKSSLLNELAPGGRDLVDHLGDAGPLLLILDECHHLLDVWGSLLVELLDLLPGVWVLGLTATPPATMTAAQTELVSGLFSSIRYSASIPAVVREGDLAPFADLVWVTAPTSEENSWLSGQAVRFTELITGILDPTQGTVPFLEWADRRFLGTRDNAVSWAAISRSNPQLCSAALRLHHRDLLRLPPGARPSEQHRRDPDSDDWALLIDDWMRHHLLASDDPEDSELAEAIRRALPAIGYRWTRSGIRAGRSPVDRVIAYSAAKPQATTEIICAEAANLQDRLRMLVLCDFESLTATLPADVRQVISEDSGSALLVLETLIADARTVGLRPLLVSGKTVAGAPDVLSDLRDLIAESDESLAFRLQISEPVSGISRLEGPWNSRTWVPYVTDFFTTGRSQVLIGTRALLGEGWDAPAITGLIDLSTATTPTAVTQTRGRALRRDPNLTQKVALNWTVVCVSPDHPRGDQDWGRLVRKHDGFFGTDSEGEIVDGVAHIDSVFSPYEPPEAALAEEINARMIARSQDRAEIAQRWRVGSDYRDEELRSVRILQRSGHHELEQPDATDPARNGEISASPRHLGGDPGRVLPFGVSTGTVVAGGGRGRVVLRLGGGSGDIGGAVLSVLGLAVWASLPVTLSAAGARRTQLYAQPPTVGQLAGAIADGLQESGQAGAGAEAVSIRVDARGDLRCHLDADAQAAEIFALALDEAVSPIADPRYLIPRWSLPQPQTGLRGKWERVRSGWAMAQQNDPVWHAVPSGLGANRESAQAYVRAWNRWVGGGEAVYTRNKEGIGILTAYRGTNPMQMSSVLRTSWH